MSESIWSGQTSDNLSSEFEVKPHSRCVIDVGADGATPGTSDASKFGGGNVHLVRAWATGGVMWVVKTITVPDSLEILTGERGVFFKLRLEGATSAELDAQYTTEPRSKA